LKVPHFLSSYLKHSERLGESHDEDQAMSLAVGGNYDAVGRMEFQFLKQSGLRKDHAVIDVGCGSGRLAVQLRDYLEARYVGIDVVPDLFQYAEKRCARTDWSFYAAPGTHIPEPDASVDFITFFSVFTHLLHEETYRYLEECKRVLKPGGKVVFSFLEFARPSHWAVFEATLLDTTADKVLNQFMDRDAIAAWALHLGLHIEAIYDGDKPFIELDEPIRWEDGRESVGTGTFGQSACVLVKP